MTVMPCLIRNATCMLHPQDIQDLLTDSLLLFEQPVYLDQAFL